MPKVIELPNGSILTGKLVILGVIASIVKSPLLPSYSESSPRFTKRILPFVVPVFGILVQVKIPSFGVVLMIGGNIPGSTRVASIAIYDEVQSLNFAAANNYALILFLVSLVLLTTIYSINKKFDAWKIK